jgi:hypothetical protein
MGGAMGEYTNEQTAALQEKIDRILDSVTHLAVALEAVKSGQVSRDEIQAGLDKRVPHEVFQLTVQTLDDRIKRLETSPERMRGWFGVAFGCAGIGFSLINTTFMIITFTLHH